MRTGTVWALRLLLPFLGAAAVLALFRREGGDLSGWSIAAAAAIPAAILLVPAVVSAALARREGAILAILWLLVTLAAEIVLVFGVGFIALDFGPH